MRGCKLLQYFKYPPPSLHAKCVFYSSNLAFFVYYENKCIYLQFASCNHKRAIDQLLTASSYSNTERHINYHSKQMLRIKMNSYVILKLFFILKELHSYRSIFHALITLMIDFSLQYIASRQKYAMSISSSFKHKEFVSIKISLHAAT